MPQKGADISDQIKKLKKVFPEAVVDGCVDFDRLKELLGSANESTEEKYGVFWVGKNEAGSLYGKSSSGKALSYQEELSSDPGNTKNLFIEGDNLDALKLLRSEYAGRVRCIYIDPPYNTGNSFVYNDSFAMTAKESGEAESSLGDLGERYTINRDSQNRFHARWLSMMYPRLMLARDLLEESGVIFISIDDGEQASLKLMCDELFGARNFLAQIVWERAFSPVNLKKHFSVSHDYILCYAKNKELAVCRGLPRNKAANSRYSNPDHDERGPWTSGDLSVGPAVESKVYEITTPGGRKVLPPSGYCWRLDKETFEQYVKENRIWFGKDGNNVPRIKRFLSEVKKGITPMTIWKHEEVGHSQDATKGLKKLFDGKAYFEYPKPVELVKRCIRLYAEEDSIVLDFFAGSGTTAQAVMELNAEDGGSRQFILVQLPERVNKRSIAYRDGYRTICDIARERIRRSAEAIRKECPGARFDGGFRAYKVK